MRKHMKELVAAAMAMELKDKCASVKCTTSTTTTTTATNATLTKTGQSSGQSKLGVPVKNLFMCYNPDKLNNGTKFCLL